MEFVTGKFKGLVKVYNQYMHPNDNPSEHDRKAFDLLSKGEVDSFIEYADSNPVNIHVRDYTSVNLLIKAQDVPNANHPCKKLVPEQELISRAIKATLYLLERGVDINYRQKNGGTALYAAVHWQNLELAELLLSKGADPNLGSTENFLNLPLISATIKENTDMIILLISYGADVELISALAQKGKGGFTLTEEQKKLLRSASNLESMIRRRRYELALGKSSVLSVLSEAQFQELCFYL
jgi:ankyrin repeat protein